MASRSACRELLRVRHTAAKPFGDSPFCRTIARFLVARGRGGRRRCGRLLGAGQRLRSFRHLRRRLCRRRWAARPAQMPAPVAGARRAMASAVCRIKRQRRIDLLSRSIELAGRERLACARNRIAQSARRVPRPPRFPCRPASCRARAAGARHECRPPPAAGRLRPPQPLPAWWRSRPSWAALASPPGAWLRHSRGLSRGGRLRAREEPSALPAEEGAQRPRARAIGGGRGSMAAANSWGSIVAAWLGSAKSTGFRLPPLGSASSSTDRQGRRRNLLSLLCGFRLEDQAIWTERHLGALGQRCRPDALPRDPRAVLAAKVGDHVSVVLPPQFRVKPGDALGGILEHQIVVGRSADPQRVVRHGDLATRECRYDRRSAWARHNSRMGAVSAGMLPLTSQGADSAGGGAGATDSHARRESESTQEDLSRQDV